MPLAKIQPDGFGGGIAGTAPCLSGGGLLRLHGGVEPVKVDRPLKTPHEILRQIERKAKSVIELEGGRAIERSARRLVSHLIIENAQAAIQRFLEARLLEFERFGDQWLRAAKFGIMRAHFRNQCRYQPPHHRILTAKLVQMPHRAAHDPAQHIAAPLI